VEALFELMAERYQMSTAAFVSTIRAVAWPKDKEGQPLQVSTEQMLAFLGICYRYDLNPITKEVWLVPVGNKGIMPVVSVDGWAKMVIRNPDYNGCEFAHEWDSDHKRILSITCKLYRKSTDHPTCATELMNECYSETSMWRRWPQRMLKHKAFIQAARFAFGLNGIADEDEAARMTSTPSDAGISGLRARLGVAASETEADTAAPYYSEGPTIPPGEGVLAHALGADRSHAHHSVTGSQTRETPPRSADWGDPGAVAAGSRKPTVISRRAAPVNQGGLRGGGEVASAITGAGRAVSPPGEAPAGDSAEECEVTEPGG
jgi:phage recombination protein Bet